MAPNHHHQGQNPNFASTLHTFYQHSLPNPQMIPNHQPQLANSPSNYKTFARQYIGNHPYTHQSSPHIRLNNENLHSQDSSIQNPVSIPNQVTQQSAPSIYNVPQGSANQSEAEQKTLPPAKHTAASTGPAKKTCPNLRQVKSILKRLAKDREPPSPAPVDQLAPVPHGGNETSSSNDLADSVMRLIPTPRGEETTKDQDSNTNTHTNNDDENNQRLAQLPDDVMEEIVGMELDELREYEALHAQNRQLPVYLKAELDKMYYEFERQLHILAIRHQLHATLLYTHIGQTNQMQGATNYNNFCRFDPEAQVIFSTSKLNIGYIHSAISSQY